MSVSAGYGPVNRRTPYFPGGWDGRRIHRTVSGKKRITVRDVADLAGVSTAVVSYVINDGPRPTSPEMRARVRRAIEELDYHPNSAARGLRANRTHTIAFMTHDFRPHESFFSHYLGVMLTGMAW